jgi:hypothetical protein
MPPSGDAAAGFFLPAVLYEDHACCCFCLLLGLGAGLLRGIISAWLLV